MTHNCKPSTDFGVFPQERQTVLDSQAQPSAASSGNASGSSFANAAKAASSLLSSTSTAPSQSALLLSGPTVQASSPTNGTLKTDPGQVQPSPAQGGATALSAADPTAAPDIRTEPAASNHLAPLPISEQLALASSADFPESVASSAAAEYLPVHVPTPAPSRGRGSGPSGGRPRGRGRGRGRALSAGSVLQDPASLSGNSATAVSVSPTASDPQVRGRGRGRGRGLVRGANGLSDAAAILQARHHKKRTEADMLKIDHHPAYFLQEQEEVSAVEQWGPSTKRKRKIIGNWVESSSDDPMDEDYANMSEDSETGRAFLPSRPGLRSSGGGYGEESDRIGLPNQSATPPISLRGSSSLVSRALHAVRE